MKLLHLFCLKTFWKVRYQVLGSPQRGLPRIALAVADQTSAKGRTSETAASAFVIFVPLWHVNACDTSQHHLDANNDSHSKGGRFSNCPDLNRASGVRVCILCIHAYTTWIRQYDTSLQCLFVRNFELFEFCMFAYLCMFDHFWSIRVVAMVWCFYSQPKFTTEQASVHSSPCLSALIFPASIRMSLESSVSSAAANHSTPIPRIQRSQLVCHSEQLHARHPKVKARWAKIQQCLRPAQRDTVHLSSEHLLFQLQSDNSVWSYKSTCMQRRYPKLNITFEGMDNPI